MSTAVRVINPFLSLNFSFRIVLLFLFLERHDVKEIANIFFFLSQMSDTLTYFLKNSERQSEVPTIFKFSKAENGTRNFLVLPPCLKRCRFKCHVVPYYVYET